MTHFIAIPVTAAVVADAHARFAAGDPCVERHIVNAAGAAPCRRCLRDGAPGEAMLLFAHSPFEGKSPYAETGPIFVHERCEAPTLDVDVLPDVTQARAQAVVRAYDKRGAIHDAALAQTADIPSTIARFFDDPAVAYAHVRSATYGCFTYRVERA